MLTEVKLDKGNEKIPDKSCDCILFFSSLCNVYKRDAQHVILNKKREKIFNYFLSMECTNMCHLAMVGLSACQKGMVTR